VKRPIEWTLGIAFALAVAANLVWAIHSIRKTDAKHEEEHKEPGRLSRDESGNPVLKIDKETQERTALKVEEVPEASLPNEMTAYGRFQEDPSRAFTLRSPAAGVARKAADREWPRLGESLADGTVVAMLHPRFTPVERLDLLTRLTTAQADVASTTASLETAKSAYERTKTLNAEGKTASDRSLQEADARLKAETAKLKAAQETVAAVETMRPLSLGVDRGGDVVELLVQPGETVESGQPILRVAKYDRLLARIALPAGSRVPAEVTAARIVPAGREDRVLEGRRTGLAPTDPQLLGETFLFSVDAGDQLLRPGMALTAYLRLPGEPTKGVLLPRSAIVRQEGSLWAYVRTADDKFARRAVERATPVEGGWFVPAGFKAGDAVVTAGAQMLLSEELKAKIQGED
jgi:multidrug efflux pump subunit AcrA (membrane-fusion protein)